MTRIALATCTNLPGWEKDDIPLHDALRERGVEYEQVSWDAPDVDWAGFDGCLIRTTWDYMDRHAEFVAWARMVESKTALWNSAKVLEWNTHKGYLADLERAGVAIAPTVWMDVDSAHDVGAIMDAHGWERGFLKPQIGACARETLRFNRDETTAAQAHLARTVPSEPMMFQPYLSSVETSGEISIFYFGGVRCHAVQKVPVPGDYRVQDDFGATDFPVEAPEAVVELAERAVSAAQTICGLEQPLVYARADFLALDSGEWVVNELELVEPSLFFRHSDAAPGRLAEELIRRAR
jgi:glutathione synthase/RimK-type ligase-like ATP-grasp enzyme